MMSSVPEAAFAMDQHLAPPQLQTAAEQEQLCYVHCKCCDTILAVRRTRTCRIQAWFSDRFRRDEKTNP